MVTELRQRDILHCNAVKKMDSAMPCHRTGYDWHSNPDTLKERKTKDRDVLPGRHPVNNIGVYTRYHSAAMSSARKASVPVRWRFQQQKRPRRYSNAAQTWTARRPNAGSLHFFFRQYYRGCSSLKRQVP